MNVVIAGGGTAGHVIPGLALARAMPEAQVTFFGTARGAEATLVPASGFVMLRLRIAGFDRGRPVTLLTSGGRAAAAVVDARRDMHLIRPDVVVGMGGYVSLPVCFAARSLGIPIVLHEQNIVFGLAHRVCKPLAARVAVSFEETLAAAGDKGVLVGNPVLPELAHLDVAAERRRGVERFGLEEGRRTLLVTGGSLGAQRINEAALGLIARWAGREDLQVVHIAGKAHHRAISDRVAAADTGGLVYRVVAFVDRMAEAYAVADLAVCRGGATTVAELSVVGLPSIIVPYPHHRDRQQELHGRALERAGGARVLPNAATTTASLGALAEELLGDRAALEAMRRGAKSFGRPDAAEVLAGVVRNVA
jgi:UDP-N-acetylglucosamine--N-acetylmuramyl-(pentapeptide) pyrophosphoryl-undecaprenol N-acetylglucosamine transferase